MGMGTDPTVSLSAELLYGILPNILFMHFFPVDFSINL